MGLYYHLKKLWKAHTPETVALFKQRMVEWRKEPVSIRIARPTRLERARQLGYKAKPGIFVVRQRVQRGGRERPMIKKGRRSKHYHQRKILGKNYQQVAEERANKRFINCEVLGSYYVAKDGLHYWYEVIFVDKQHPVIKSSKSDIKWIAEKQHRGRSFRGLTSAARKSRGLRKKGKGAEKARPSSRAHQRRQG